MMKYCFYTAILVVLMGMSHQAVAQHPAGVARLQKNYQIDRLRSSEGRIIIQQRDEQAGRGKFLFGFADTLGNVLVKPIYTRMGRFQNGFTFVEQNGKSGMINRNGNFVVPCEFALVRLVNDGVAVAYKYAADSLRNYFLIDTLGTIHPISYSYCDDFSYGLAVAGQGTYTKELTPSGKTRKAFNGKYGYITPDGKQAIPMQFDKARDFEKNGLAAVGMQGNYYIKWGFIDRTGKQVIPCNYYQVERFEGGLAVVSKVMPGGKLAYGYIDIAGNEAIACQYDEAMSFRHVNTWVGTLKNDQMHFQLIDRRGQLVIPFSVLCLQQSEKYGHVACAIEGEGGRLFYGILSNAGKVVLPFEYDELTIFAERDPDTGKFSEAAMATKNGKRFSLNIGKRE